MALLCALFAASCAEGAGPTSDDKADDRYTAGGTISADPDATTETTGDAQSGNAEADGDLSDGVAKQWDAPPPMNIKPNRTYTATVKTKAGDIVIELLPKVAPATVNNFVFLAREGFYTNVPIHRIMPGFMIQTGDPTGTGGGGPGYTIPDEPVKGDYPRGTVAMARTPQPDSAGSQFFIALVDLTQTFPNKEYVIFGRVTEGMDVVDKIAKTPIVVGDSGERSTPATPVFVESVSIKEGRPER